MSASVVQVRLPWTRLRIRPRVPLAVSCLVAVAAGLTVAHLLVGEAGLSAGDAVRAVLLRGDADTQFVMWQLRLPRPVVGLAAGAALGGAGALLQRVTGNDLAAPELVGVVAGANLGMTILVFGFPLATPGWRVPVALLGGLAMGGLVLVASGGARSPLRVLLVGAGVTVMAQAVVTAVVSNGELVHAFRIVLWMVGGLSSVSWADATVMVNGLLVLGPLALLLSRRLDHLDLGPDMATTMGVPVRSTCAVALAVGTCLAAVAVSVVGPIAFVGLVAPHLARRLVGTASASLLVVSAAVGGNVVVLADLAGRTLWAPTEIPTGVLVPLVGVPLLITLLRRQAGAR